MPTPFFQRVCEIVEGKGHELLRDRVFVQSPKDIERLRLCVVDLLTPVYKTLETDRAGCGLCLVYVHRRNLTAPVSNYGMNWFAHFDDPLFDGVTLGKEFVLCVSLSEGGSPVDEIRLVMPVDRALVFTDAEWELLEAADAHHSMEISCPRGVLYGDDRTCCACGKEGKEGEKFKFCARCRIAYYCSRACQRAHWKRHKKECRDAKE